MNKNDDDEGSTASDFSESDEEDSMAVSTPINYRDSIAIPSDELSALLGVEEKKKSKMEALFAKRHNSLTGDTTSVQQPNSTKKNSLLYAVRNQLVQIENEEVSAVKALMLCINSPFQFDGHIGLEIMSTEDQMKEYFDVICHGFKASTTRMKDKEFEKCWEDSKAYDSIFCLEQQQKLLFENNHPYFNKENITGDFVAFVENLSPKLVEKIKSVRKETSAAPEFKASLNITLSKVNFGEPEKYLAPKREFTYSVRVDGVSSTSKTFVVDSEVGYLEWKSPLTFETTKKDAQIHISLKYKSIFGKKSAFELNMKLSELMSQFQKPDANWGKKSFNLTLPIAEKDLPIGNTTINFKLKFQRKYTGKESLITLDSHKLYSIIIKNFIFSRSKRKTNLTVFTQFERAILNEFTSQHLITEAYKTSCLLQNILECKHKKLIMTFSDVLHDGLISLTNLENENKIFTKAEENMKLQIFNLANKKAEEYLGFYLQHFVIKKAPPPELDRFVQIFKMFYPEKEYFYSKVIKKTVDNDFSLICEELTSKEMNQELSAFSIYQICETMKQHMVKNDVTVLFPKEQDYSTDVVERYYELFSEILTEFLEGKQIDSDIFNLLKLCESLSTLHQSISTFMAAKQKEFKPSIDPYIISNKYAHQWIDEMKTKSHSIVHDSVAVDFFSPIETSKYSTSFVDIFRSFYEICSLIEHLKFEDEKVIKSISTIICQATADYSQYLTEISLNQDTLSNDGLLTFKEKKLLSKKSIVIINNLVSARKQLLCLLDQILENDEERKSLSDKTFEFTKDEIVDKELYEDYKEKTLIFHPLIHPYLKLMTKNVDSLSDSIASIFENPFKEFIENMKQLDPKNNPEDFVKSFNKILQEELFDIILTPNIKKLNEECYGTLVIIIVKKIYNMIIEVNSKYSLNSNSV
jgi:hypothetical protein